MITLGISQPETRSSYTSAALGYFYGEAMGRTGRAAATGALQTASGILSRAFAAAQPSGDLGLLTPHVLSAIGFDLIRHGESVHLLEVTESGPALLRAGRTDGAAVQGGADPRNWIYTLTLPGPGETRTVTAPRPRRTFTSG